MIDHGFKTWSCGVMVIVLPSSVIDHGFKTWSCGVMVSTYKLFRPFDRFGRSCFGLTQIRP